MKLSAWFSLVPLLALSMPVAAEPTPMTVRVIARDAKFVGTLTGGARVTLRDVESGEVLAQGVTEGNTGETQRIMHATERQAVRSGEGDAAFNAQLDIDRPTLVELEAEGPLGFPQSMLKVTQQRWILPGEGVTQGEGWTIELPGIIITPDTRVAGGRLAIEAHVQLTCGCPLTPGGLWDEADYEVKATLWRDGTPVATAPLAFVAEPGGYAGEIALPDARDGRYRLGLFALNTRTGNSGYTELAVAAQ